MNLIYHLIYPHNLFNYEQSTKGHLHFTFKFHIFSNAMVIQFTILTDTKSESDIIIMKLSGFTSKTTINGIQRLYFHKVMVSYELTDSDTSDINPT